MIEDTSENSFLVCVIVRIVVQDARGGFPDFPSFAVEEVCALSVEEAAGAGAGGAAGDTAHHATAPRPPRHNTILRLSL